MIHSLCTSFQTRKHGTREALQFRFGLKWPFAHSAIVPRLRSSRFNLTDLHSALFCSFSVAKMPTRQTEENGRQLRSCKQPSMISSLALLISRRTSVRISCFSDSSENESAATDVVVLSTWLLAATLTNSWPVNDCNRLLQHHSRQRIVNTTAFQLVFAYRASYRRQILRSSAKQTYILSIISEGPTVHWSLLTSTQTKNKKVRTLFF